MTPKEFYENLEKKKPFTELTSTGINDNLTNVFEFAKTYAEAITVTHCCKSDSEQLLFTQEEIVARINEQTVLNGETFRNYFDKK